MEQVRIGDRLVFYLLRTTVKGVIAVYKVVSDVYEDNSDIWGKDRYPLRVRIEPIYNFENSGKRLVPLGFVYGGDSTSGIIVEPFLKNIWISKMEKHQYERLGRLFEGDK